MLTTINDCNHSDKINLVQHLKQCDFRDKKLKFRQSKSKIQLIKTYRNLSFEWGITHFIVDLNNEIKLKLIIVRKVHYKLYTPTLKFVFFNLLANITFELLC